MSSQKRKIIINGRFLTQKVTGVQRYARELLAEFEAIAVNYDLEMVIPKKAEVENPLKNIKLVRYGNLFGHLWEQISFARYVRKSKGISLNLCNTAPLFCKKIVVIHDMKVKAHPEYFSWKFNFWYKILFKNTIKKSVAIITVSEFSKAEIIKYYPKVDDNKIFVVYNAWQHFDRIGYDDCVLSKYGLKENNYFFAMSSFEPNKNFKWIAETAQRYPRYTFAIAGSINKKVFKEGLGFDCPDNMKLLGYVSDEEAKTLMRDCRAFLFPSIYEGFGIPPLEAVAAGAKSIIVSDILVMHEIFGDMATYITEDFSLTDNVAEKDYAELLQKFSWQKSAEKLLEVLKRLG